MLVTKWTYGKNLIRIQVSTVEAIKETRYAMCPIKPYIERVLNCNWGLNRTGLQALRAQSSCYSPKLRRIPSVVGTAVNDRENPLLVTDQPVEVQDSRKFTHHFRGIYKIYTNLTKKNCKMSTYNKLDLESLGSRIIIVNNLADTNCSCIYQCWTSM